MFRTKDHKVEKLAQVDLFRRCDQKHLQAIAGVVDEVEIAAGSVLFKEGQSARAAYVIVEGEVEVEIGGEVVAKVGAGETVGEMSLIDHAPRSATVTATAPVKAYAIHASNFVPLLEDNPSVAIAIMQDLSERLRNLENDPAKFVAPG